MVVRPLRLRRRAGGRGGARSSASWTTGCSRCATSRTFTANSLSRLADDGARLDRLCELNVLVQARRLCRSTVVQQAWERGQRLVVHAWVYRLNDGLLRDLGFGATSLAAAEAQYARAAGSGTVGPGGPGARGGFA